MSPSLMLSITASKAATVTSWSRSPAAARRCLRRRFHSAMKMMFLLHHSVTVVRCTPAFSAASRCVLPAMRASMAIDCRSDTSSGRIWPDSVGSLISCWPHSQSFNDLPFRPSPASWEGDWERNVPPSGEQDCPPLEGHSLRGRSIDRSSARFGNYSPASGPGLGAPLASISERACLEQTGCFPRNAR